LGRLVKKTVLGIITKGGTWKKGGEIVNAGIKWQGPRRKKNGVKGGFHHCSTSSSEKLPSSPLDKKKKRKGGKDKKKCPNQKKKTNQKNIPQPTTKKGVWEKRSFATVGRSHMGKVLLNTSAEKKAENEAWANWGGETVKKDA